jgi:SPP1 family predicted phage head-tail adaptor
VRFAHFGQMRDRIRIDAKTQSTDASGNVTVTWAPFATVWGNMDRKTAEQAFRAGRDEGLRKFEITIRWIAGVGTDNRIHWRGRNFDVEGAENMDGIRQYLTLFATERNADGDDGVAGT